MTVSATMCGLRDWLQKKLGSKTKIMGRGDITTIRGKVPTTDELGQLFKSIKDDPDLQWNYLTGGCEARAHATCKRLLDKGINCYKIFVKVPAEYYKNNLNGELTAENKYYKGDKKAGWLWHVATLVFAQDRNGNVQAYVIDPAVNGEGPMKVDDWIRSMWDGKFPLQIDITQPHAYGTPEMAQENVEPEEFSQEKFNKNLPEANRQNREIKDDWEKEKKNRR